MTIFFNTKVIKPGDKYGLNDGLVNDSGKDLFEFYDPRYIAENRFGQFVSRYYVKTLLKDRSKLEAGGLDLHSGVPDWSVTPEQMKAVFEQLTHRRTQNDTIRKRFDPAFR